jgi:hypothetical protein
VRGRRNYLAERARHAARAPETQRTLYATLVAQLPQYERALVGREAILAELHRLGLRRRNGTPLTWRMILRWRRDLGFPLVRGVWHPHTALHPSSRSPALTTTYAVTAWVLSQFSTDSQGMFRVFHPAPSLAQGSRPALPIRSVPGIGKGRWVRPLASIRLTERA